ncbi:GDSL esterase/lipase 4-like [Silene latifolia]|uniref:GDSL esterase/lipase 4-like n=1 Tax=Silene latifolia TaxID=37657 RepID=UPI003D772C3B
MGRITRENMTTNTLTLCVITLYMISFRLTTAEFSGNTTTMFVFGDSLYDGGMTFYSGIKGAGAEFWPYGNTHFRKPAGRYCDGRLIPDFLAQYAGLPFPEPYLKPGFTDYAKGVNFAAAGACVLVELRPNTIYLKRQIKYFVEMIPKLEGQIGKEETKTLLSKAVYLLNIAGNDYVTLFQNNMGKTISPSRKRQFVNQIMGNITIHLKKIYSLGGRKFAFQNVGPLGCMPSMKYMLGFKGLCHEETLEIAKMHNAAFLTFAKKWEIQFPGFKYSIHDFHGSLYSRVLQPEKFGFKEGQTGCCGSGDYHGDFTCQKRGKSFSVCSNPNDYLWFDAAHPTDMANQQFSRDFWSGDSDVVSPLNLQTLFAL